MLKRWAAFVVLVLLMLAPKLSGFADTTPPARPDTFAAGLPVYDKNKNESSVTLNWTASTGADFYILEIITQANWAGQSISEQRILNTLTYTDIRQNVPSSPITGTVFVYKLYAATYVRDEDGKPTADYVKSTTYDTATVLTDPSVSAKALSTSQIQLTWDDVQYNEQSIGYTIDKFKNGVNVGQDQILVSQIGSSVQKTGGKLIYTVANLDQSTGYTFRLSPGLDSNSIVFNPYVLIDSATNINALLQQYNESIVKLMWDEYQGSIPATNLYYKVVEVSTDASGNKTYSTIATPEVPYYYIELEPGKTYSYIVEVHKLDDDSKIAQSAEISMEDIIIPLAPVTPDTTYTVADSSITVNWNTYNTIDGERDNSIKFDVWMLTDPTTINTVRAYYVPDSSGIADYRIAKDLDINNNVNPAFTFLNISGTNKYQFVISGLTPNSTYYIAIVAKKTYLMQDPNDNNQIISEVYTSEPAMATMKTTSGNLEQPVAIVKPPGLEVATDPSGSALVTKNSVTITWPLGQTVSGIYTPSYQSDVYFKVGYQTYDQTFNKNKTNDPSNIDYNMKTTGVNITLGTQEATANITGLKGSTAYVFWVKAYRDIPGTPIVTKASEASDPIIVVTLPDYTVPNAKPTVPSFTVLDNQFSDKITLQFNSMANIKYTIAWGTEDNVAKKTGTKEYTPLSSLTPDSLIINGLKPNTIYYFWIMATNDSISSDWSDSEVGKTTPLPPPDPVEGFGVKNVLENGELVPDIGEHYISLQWDKLDDIDYIIEVSKSSDFSDSDKNDVGNVSEYKLTTFKDKEIPSNVRLWIRIFAKDTTTSYLSVGSNYLTVKTKYNYDEYDSSSDDEEPVSTKMPAGNINGTTGIWSVDYSGTTGDVLIQKIKSQSSPDYSIDLSQTSVVGINERQVLIPYKVLDALSSSNQNLIVKTNNAEFVFLPGNINAETISSLRQNGGDEVDIKINVKSQTPSSSDTDTTHKPVSNISIISVTAQSALENKQIINFDKPIKIKLKYVDDNTVGIVLSYHMLPGKSMWEKMDGDKAYIDNTPYIVVLSDGTGRYLVRKQIPDSGQLGYYIFKNEVDKIMATDLMKSVDSNNIHPIDFVTLGDAVKMLLDASKTSYDNNYMDIAQKAGLLNVVDNVNPAGYISTEESVAMVMKLYEIRTGQTLPQLPISGIFADKGDVGDVYKNYIANALDMKILTRLSSYISPQDDMTRGEMLAMVERLLENLGEV